MTLRSPLAYHTAWHRPHAADPSTPQPVRLAVDATQVKGPMTPVWAWFGYDEPNYTTAPDGKKLLSDIAALMIWSAVPAAGGTISSMSLQSPLVRCP